MEAVLKSCMQPGSPMNKKQVRHRLGCGWGMKCGLIIIPSNTRGAGCGGKRRRFTGQVVKCSQVELSN